MRPAIDERFRIWLASAPSTGVPVDTIQIYHPKWGYIYLARWRSPFTAFLENGQQQTFQSADFAIEPTGIESSTGQTVRAAINGLDGQLYAQLKKLNTVDRQTPILLAYRLYLDTLRDRPLIDPPLVLEVVQAKCERDVVNLDLSSTDLPNISSGRYYLLKDYPALSDI